MHFYGISGLNALDSGTVSAHPHSRAPQRTEVRRGLRPYTPPCEDVSPHRIPPLLATLNAVTRTLEVGVGAAIKMLETAPLVWVGGLLTSFAVALFREPFTWAWGMLVFASVVDYATGVATARAYPEGHRHAYDPFKAARGRREKIITGVLMIGCRMMEGLATEFGMLDIAGVFAWLNWEDVANAPAIQQGGILSTFVTMLIALQEWASVYKHRLENGGSRILILEFIFSTVDALLKFALGKAASKVSEWAQKDAGDNLIEQWVAQEMMDDAAYRAKHGEPAPRRRAYDAAVKEAEDAAKPPKKKGPPADG
jgi:hypothetical protein